MDYISFPKKQCLKKARGPTKGICLYFYLASRCPAFGVLFFVSLYQEQDTFQQTIKVVKINMSQPSVFISSFSSLTFDRCLEKEIFQSPDVFVKNKEAY